MDFTALGIGLMAFGMLGAALGVASIFSALLNGISRNPSAEKQLSKYAFIGAGTVVLEDIKPFALIVGVPGKQIGWMSKDGEKLNLPITGFGHAICSYSGLSYKLENDKCFLEEV